MATFKDELGEEDYIAVLQSAGFTLTETHWNSAEQVPPEYFEGVTRRMVHAAENKRLADTE